MRKIKILLIAIFLFMATGCSSTYSDEDSVIEFHKLLDDMFEQSVSDPLSLAFALDNYDGYDIDSLKLEFDGEVEIDSEYIFEQLEKINPEALSQTEQYQYQNLYYYYENLSELEQVDFDLSVFTASNNVIINMGINFYEFKISKEDDLKLYLKLLNELPTYIDDALEYEVEISNEGKGLTDTGLDDAISMIEPYTNTSDTNPIYTRYLAIIADSNIDQEILDKYTPKIKEAILKDYAASCNKAMTTLESLKGTRDIETAGMENLDNGQEAYEYLFKLNTGAEGSVEDYKEILEKNIYKHISTMTALFSYYDSSIDDGSCIEKMTPQEYIDLLQSKYTENFTELPIDIELELSAIANNTTTENIQGYFINPEVDNYTKNIIRYNPENIDNNYITFMVLCHEGFPGHLYQHIYLYSTDLHDIIKLSGALYYVEGWATYAQSYIPSYIDFKNNGQAKLSEINVDLNWDVTVYADILVNYYGYSEAELSKALDSFGFMESDEIANQLFEVVANDPANQLSYSIPKMFIHENYDRCKDALGSDFNEKEFHDQLLKHGSLDEATMNKVVDDYIASKQ